MSGPAPGTRLRGPARALVSAAASCLVVTAFATGCDLDDEKDPPASSTPVTPSASTDPAVDQTVLVQDVDGRPVQVGHADVTVSETTLEGGSTRAVDGPGGAPAFRFPAYRAAGSYPRAVLVVTNAGKEDQLNPGTRAFTWGTDFVVDARSEGRPEDNGDNLIQRGLYSEPTLYKAELDLQRPACVVRGSDGTATVRSGTAIIPGIWYHMECAREGAEVTVTTWPLSDPDTRTSRSVVAPTGDVTPQDPGVPLSIGGKVAQDGAIIESATDQMNGDLADPFLTIDGR